MFQQQKGALNHSGGFCCLGVACAIFAEEAGVKVIKGVSKRIEYDGYDAVLPDAMQRFLELDYTGTLRKNIQIGIKTYTTLASLNDLAGYTFDQIADVIDEQF